MFEIGRTLMHDLYSITARSMTVSKWFAVLLTKRMACQLSIKNMDVQCGKGNERLTRDRQVCKTRGKFEYTCLSAERPFGFV